MALEARLVTEKERTLFTIGVVFSTVVWLLLTVGTIGIGLIYAVFIGLLILMAHALFLAHVRGNGVLVSPQQLPDLYDRCQAAAKKLGMTAAPDVYVMQSGGILNAFATKLLSRKFVILYSSLADSCEDPRELDFVIGHELGHHAAGHLTWNAFLAPYRLCPWLGPAYSRAREYTCDRAGMGVVGDLEASSRALAVLAAGGKLARQVDLKAFTDQRLSTGHFWMATLELNMSHPYLCKRVAALQNFDKPGTVAVPGRTVWAYPFAPFFGIAAGGSSGAIGALMVLVAMAGIAAAIAIPAFMKYKHRAEDAQSQMMQQFMQQMQAPDADDKQGDAKQGGSADQDEQQQLQQILKQLQDAEKNGAAGEDDGAEPSKPKKKAK